MRITRKRYEKCKQLLKDMAACKDVVQKWEDAVGQMGSLGDLRLAAIEFADDGSVKKTECEPCLPQIKIAASQKGA